MDTSPITPGRADNASTFTVGYDGSDAAAAAVRWAASEAFHRGGTLRVLSCVNDRAEPNTDRILPDPRPVYEMAEWLMRSQAAHVRHPGAEFTFSLVWGSAERRLVSESGGSDLLVIGSGGHLLLGAWRLGAITHEILRHARCPVVLVPSGHVAGGHGRVLVGVEDDTSNAALTWAATEADRRRAELVIVHARRSDEILEPASVEHASSILAEAARVAEAHCDTPITTRMVDGPPAPSLLAQAYNADMLVVGVRAAGHGAAHDKPGSVARAVGACATSPTVIVQPGAVHTDPTRTCPP